MTDPFKTFLLVIITFYMIADHIQCHYFKDQLNAIQTQVNQCQFKK